MMMIQLLIATWRARWLARLRFEPMPAAKIGAMPRGLMTGRSVAGTRTSDCSSDTSVPSMIAPLSTPGAPV